MLTVPFIKLHCTGNEENYIKKALTMSGNRALTRQCHALLQQYTQCLQVSLTHSCTAALEMSALLLDIQPGDEIIMPSYTFVSTANAFVLRGGIPVFVDVRTDTLNIDENKIEPVLTEKTKAIVPVHYAGIACNMEQILTIAKQHHLYVVEDAAQCLLAKYRGQMLGTFGHLGTYSFHETKNVVSSEGGAVLINDERFIKLAEVIREKGTDRSRFLRGEIDKYTWEHVGSSFLPSELTAAFLLAQLEQAETITERRLTIWNQYHQAFADLEKKGWLRRPIVPDGCEHNGHMYYLLLPNAEVRNQMTAYLKNAGISAVYHYVPLHSSPGGLRYGRFEGNLTVTDDIAGRLLRLPLYFDMTNADIEHVIETVQANTSPLVGRC